MATRVETAHQIDAGANALRLVALFTVVFASLYTVALGGASTPVYVLGPILAGSLGVIYAVERRVGRAIGIWGTYILVFLVLVDLRALADQSGLPVRAGYVVGADQKLFGGTLPSAWLQTHLHRAGHLGALEVFCMGVYASFFVVPHMMAYVLWRRDPRAFRRYLGSIVLAVLGSLVAFYAVPTAPPWLASHFTHAPNVGRMISEVLGPSSERIGSAPGGNAVAAMPSLHLGLTVLVAAALFRHRLGIRIVAVLYVFSMAFALVYLGEHFVLDELAGTTLALAAWALAPRLMARFGIETNRAVGG